MVSLNIFTKIRPAINPPIWANQATPPDASIPKEDIPEISCAINQKPRIKKAGIGIILIKIKNQNKV